MATDAAPVDPFTVGAMMCTVALTLLFNGVVIGVMLFNRSLLKESFSIHILTLCFTDFSVGLLSIPAVVMYIYREAVTYTFCASCVALVSMGQCASLYHVIGICIYRVLVLSKNERPPKWKRKYLHYHVPCVWISSVVVLSFPFAYWGQSGVLLKFCSPGTLFGENYNKAMGFIMGCYLSSLVVVDILYIYLSVIIYKKQQQVFPVSTRNQVTSLADTSIQPQRQTHFTIKIILVLFNVFLLPFTTGIMVEVAFESVTLSRKLKLVLFSWALLNSILNPIVYAGRIKPLRDYVLYPFRALTRYLRNVCTSTVAPMANDNA